MKTPEVAANHSPMVKEIHILWTPDGLSCDGDTVSITAATQPSIEDLVMGAIPGLPKVHLHNRVLAPANGADYMKPWFEAAEGKLDPFVLVVEGSIPNEDIKEEGYWAAIGTDPVTDQPITLNTWIDRLAPKALAVVAAGTCAAYGGIHAMQGNPTGAMGLTDYLGRGWRSKGGLPVVNVPGCPVQPDNMMETLLYLLYQLAGMAPMIPLDDQLRPTWLFGKTVHEGCDRGSYYEQADFAHEYGSPKCLVKIGCWGPVVNCNVTKRGWMDGIGGCPNVGGICIACTMPGFPDKFMPFMDEAPGGTFSSTMISGYGRLIRSLRAITNKTINKEPKWRHAQPVLTTGYRPKHYGHGNGSGNGSHGSGGYVRATTEAIKSRAE
ncbi:MAG TPA: hydrogenase expression protein HypE [Verrucomicrobiae bacterium]|nr:hydrogenase expression protein HypE [Verrucomicrobiae bacterium]